jgi:hypothetical protein
MMAFNMCRPLAVILGTLAVSSVAVSAQQPGRLVSPRAGDTTNSASPSKATAATPSAKDARLLPGTRPSAVTTVQGSALNSSNGVLPDVPVRLRDVRFGRIVATTTTDKAGVFTFKAVDPGSYVVEIMGNDSQVLAASQILTVEAGTAVTALVQLPLKFAAFGGMFAHGAASAVAISTAAAASGVMAVKVANCVSPPCQ